MKRGRVELFELLKKHNPNFRQEVVTVRNRLGRLVTVVRYHEYPTDQHGNELSLRDVERLLDGERVVRVLPSGQKVIVRFETSTERRARLERIKLNQKSARQRQRAAWEARKGRRRRWSAACDSPGSWGWVTS